ncbi:DUF4190 domain-containing protein [Oerskovia sp. KBS0722]|uniref:DUF4190 domain-containing protein n=1 Tax=Oerskovia sp. KBS0722 TaxID=1179673 RepID=UPI00143CC369|nr:DUF4190 domain-containing protein [Oerskovia sp. KBS0722]
MTSPPPQGSDTPDQDPYSSPAPPYSPGGASRQPPLVPYRPPSGADDAPVPVDPYAPPAPGSTAAHSSPGHPAPGPYGAPGTPVYGTAPGAYGVDPSAGQHAPGYPAGHGPGHAPDPGYLAGYGPGHPPGYGLQPGWPPTPSWDASFAPPPRQNGLALASMITSLAGLLLCMVPGIVGLVLGIVALQQIGRDGTTGRGFAITGIAAGAVGTAFVVLWIFAMVGTW